MNLERAKRTALESLAGEQGLCQDVGFPLHGNPSDGATSEHWHLVFLGLGYAVASGWARYRGMTGPTAYFRISGDGLRELSRMCHEDAPAVPVARELVD